jgi:F-type H+-transporting ATPase subunit delta
VIQENPEFRRLLHSPIIPAGKKNKIIAAIFKSKLNELSFRFLQLVTRKERAVHLDSIALAFIKQYKTYHNIINITLTSAVALDENSRQELVAKLSEQTHKTIDLTQAIDPDLLGGFVLTMEDKKYDASIRHQLERLHKSFDKNLYIKGF